jgi:hypothetical protein
LARYGSGQPYPAAPKKRLRASSKKASASHTAPGKGGRVSEEQQMPKP